MPDENTPAPAPLISEATANGIRELADHLEREHAARPDPAKAEYAQSLRRSLEAYRAAPAPIDTRTPAQQLHDRHMGVEPRQPHEYDINPYALHVAEGQDAGVVVSDARRWAAALQLSPIMGKVIVHDILSKRDAQTPEQVAAQLPAGMSYADAVKDVELMLRTRTPMYGSTFMPKATDLSGYSLAQLALWSAWTRRHADGRPK